MCMKSSDQSIKGREKHTAITRSPVVVLLATCWTTRHLIHVAGMQESRDAAVNLHEVHLQEYLMYVQRWPSRGRWRITNTACKVSRKCWNLNESIWAGLSDLKQGCLTSLLKCYQHKQLRVNDRLLVWKLCAFFWIIISRPDVWKDTFLLCSRDFFLKECLWKIGHLQKSPRPSSGVSTQ